MNAVQQLIESGNSTALWGLRRFGPGSNALAHMPMEQFRLLAGFQTVPVAYGATSLIFAVLHLNWQALLPILVLSLLLCLAYRRTGSIIPSIVGHAVNNTAAFCILYFTTGPV